MSIKKQFCLLIFFLNFHLFSVSQNSILKIFHHQGINQDKIVFYLKDVPIVSKKVVKNEKNNFCEIIYIFKNIGNINAETLDEILKINKDKYGFYEVRFERNLKTNEFTLKIIFQEKNNIKIDPFLFDSISSYKGITFNISHPPLKKVSVQQKPVIVIDVGHGGHDTGAIGNHINEKDITYALAIKLSKILKNKNFITVLTRNTDKFVSLDNRTTFANLLPCFLFVSLHANFSKNPNASGIETFYADDSLLFDLENSHPLQSSILNNKSKLLANLVHNEIINVIKQLNPQVTDRRVKKSISQVLLGTEKPSILLELGFLSNKFESELLNSPQYQEIMANGIAKGIIKFMELSN